MPEDLRLSTKSANAFLNELYARCFELNFGTLSKRDFEIMLFHYLHESMKDADGSKLNDSDFELGKRLGITNARVRSLKEQENLKYPPKPDWWKDAFTKCLSGASFDESTKLVKFTVTDINLMKEIRNYFDQIGVYNEYQLNPSLFQCKLDVLLDACFRMLKDGVVDSSAERKILEVFNKHIDEKIKTQYYAAEHPVKAAMKNLAGEAVKRIFDELPLGEISGTAFRTLCQVVRRSYLGNREKDE